MQYWWRVHHYVTCEMASLSWGFLLLERKWTHCWRSVLIWGLPAVASSFRRTEDSTSRSSGIPYVRATSRSLFSSCTRMSWEPCKACQGGLEATPITVHVQWRVWPWDKGGVGQSEKQGGEMTPTSPQHNWLNMGIYCVHWYNDIVITKGYNI